MDKCRFLRQKKQVQINGEWVDTRSYRYIPYCGGGLQGVTFSGLNPSGKIVVGFGHPDAWNLVSKTIQLDGNGNGYLGLESTDVIYYIDAETESGYHIEQGTIEINGCYVNSLGYMDGDEPHYGPYVDTVIINCSSFDYLFPTHTTVFHFNGKNLMFNSFDTSNLRYTRYMFSTALGLNKITSLDLRSFNTSEVFDMQYMFQNCDTLTSLDVSSFDTSKVTDMKAMFVNCQSLTSLDVSNFNTSNVSGMSSMFSSCHKLTSLDVSHFNTSSVTYMWGMFGNCSSLKSLNLSNFDFSNVTSMQFMFDGCSSLESIDLSNWNLNYVKNFNDLFEGCTSLRTVYMRNCDSITIGRIKDNLRDAHILDQVTIITE